MDVIAHVAAGPMVGRRVVCILALVGRHRLSCFVAAILSPGICHS